VRLVACHRLHRFFRFQIERVIGQVTDRQRLLDRYSSLAD
jgi:hypothetical protein